MRAFAVVVVLAVVAPNAHAHHSASHWGPFYIERYLACDHAPEQVHCVGPIRAGHALLAGFDVGELLPGMNHDVGLAAAHRAAVDAVYFNVREAIPALRELLARRPLPRDRNEHTMLEKQALRAEAAYALAHLGDRASADAIAGLVFEFETDGHGSLWDDTLAALAVIDPALASRYAIDFIGRAHDFKMSMPGGSSKLVALDFIRDASALPVLERVAAREQHGDDHAYCELMATRVRLDPKLRASVRRELVGSYSGTWLAGCAEAVLHRLGRDPDDIPALVRHLGRDDRGMDFGVTNIAYERILELLATTPRGGRMAEALRRELAVRSKWPHVADPSHANYAPHFVAMHEAALAALGDPAARRTLYDVIEHADGDADRDGAAWLAAYWALRLRLDGAADRVAALIARDFSSPVDTRYGVFHGIRTRVLDLYADLAPDDARWSILLLSDPRSEVAERALYRISRHAPRGICDAVVGAAASAKPEAVEHALLALTTKGDLCRDAVGRLADDTRAPREVRGTALEIDAALGDPDLGDRIARAKQTGVWKPAIQRAELVRR